MTETSILYIACVMCTYSTFWLPSVTDVNGKFLQWIKDTFGQLGEVKMTQGPLHGYLGMTLDSSLPGQVYIDMSHDVKKMVKEFPQEHLKGASVASPWNENLFKVQAELFHTMSVQGLFLCMHGHLDIAPAIAYLTTWVQKPNHTDWTKLCQMLQFLKQTVKDKLTLRADGSGHLRWHVAQPSCCMMTLEVTQANLFDR